MAGKIRKTTKGKSRNFRTTKEGAGMTKKGVAAYKRKNPGKDLFTNTFPKKKIPPPGAIIPQPYYRILNFGH